MITSVRGRSSFDRLRTEGRRLRSPLVRVVTVDATGLRPGPDDEDHLEIAFVLPRRFGSAVERNRSRRRLRAALREVVARRSKTRARSGRPNVLRAMLLLTPRRDTLEAPFEQLVAELDRLLGAVTLPPPAPSGDRRR